MFALDYRIFGLPYTGLLRVNIDSLLAMLSQRRDVASAFRFTGDNSYLVHQACVFLGHQ
jgi:hypothetical protein